MARYLAISFSTIIVTFFVFSGNAFAANPQIRSITPLTQPGVEFPLGQPLGLGVVFDRSIYGLNRADIITNGRVIRVEGSNSNYRIVVVPTQRLLSLDILADSARALNGKGNDLVPNGPFVFDTKTGQVLSGGGFGSAFGYAGYQQPEQEKAAPVKVAKEKRAWTDPYQGYRFIMNLGGYASGPAFINIAGQTSANAGASQELNLGFETSHLFPGSNSISGGFYLLTGYHRTLFEGTGTEASYTAIPLEMGGGFHVRNVFTLGIGAITHLNGAYRHNGPVNFIDQNGRPLLNPNTDQQYTVDTTANFNSQIGVALNLKFRVNKFALNFKYLRLPLGNFNDATNNLGLELDQSQQAAYQTSNFINSFGFFLGFNS